MNGPEASNRVSQKPPPIRLRERSRRPPISAEEPAFERPGPPGLQKADVPAPDRAGRSPPRALVPVPALAPFLAPASIRASPEALSSKPEARPSKPEARPSKPEARPSKPEARPSKPEARPSKQEGPQPRLEPLRLPAGFQPWAPRSRQAPLPLARRLSLARKLRHAWDARCSAPPGTPPDRFAGKANRTACDRPAPIALRLVSSIPNTPPPSSLLLQH